MNKLLHDGPRIWLVTGDKLGDNAQVKQIADNLGLPYATKRLLPKQEFILGKPRFQASLAHLDLKNSDPLTQPWPDLVITVGRRHAMAALWIKERNPTTKIVLLGRPRRWIERFDLVIALPQYQIPDRPNVMRLNLPLMRPDKKAIAAAAVHWQSEFEKLEKPVIGVLVGGPTRPYRFDRRVAADLISQCVQLQKQYGGTLYFSTSRRTPEAIVNELTINRPAGSILHTWDKDAAVNPYLALLQHADYFVVTGDSISMMIEVADCGKPLAIFPLNGDWRGRMWQRIQTRMYDNPGPGFCNLVFRQLGDWLYKAGLAGFGRNLDILKNRLVESGFAVVAGQPFITPVQPLPDELARITDRTRQLIGITAGRS